MGGWEVGREGGRQRGIERVTGGRRSGQERFREGEGDVERKKDGQLQRRDSKNASGVETETEQEEIAEEREIERVRVLRGERE